MRKLPATSADGMSAVVLSFDVEEHNRIEAAVGLDVAPALVCEYADRMAASTYRLLDQLGDAGVVATFFVVGQIAESHPKLVRAIAAAGHEVGSHGWDHRRVSRFTPATFRTDLLKSKTALEQAAGTRVVGYRAPTFSVTHATPWAIDVLADAGFRYDSSIFPVRHDRYGVARAPRVPFVAVGPHRAVVELPPATLRFARQNLPVGGGGYFRLFPPAVIRAGIEQLAATGSPAVMLYFHPWEFDPDQPKLRLGRLAKWRTYVGVGKTTARLDKLLTRYAGRFRRAVDVADDLDPTALRRYVLAPTLPAEPAVTRFRVPGPVAVGGPTRPRPARPVPTE